MLGTRHLSWTMLLASCAVNAQSQAAGDPVRGRGVPVEYAGNWVCQSAVPGYNLPMPVIPGQAPSMQRMTTPPSVVVVKFTLGADGSYEASNAKGHYSFDAARKRIDWLDGLHRERFSKTELSRRSDGAPALHTYLNQRYYGCFLAKGSGPSGVNSNERVLQETKPAPASGRSRYTKEEFAALAHRGAKYYSNGDLNSARSIFEDLVAAEPGSAAAHASLGALLVRVKEDENALFHLDRAIALDPGELSAYVNRGELYLRMGRRPEGEADLKKAISFDPAGKNPAANRARGLLRGTIRY